MELFYEILLILLISVAAQDFDDEDPVAIELILADFDLTDAYDDISEATKKVVLENKGFQEKIKMEKARGNLVKIQSEKNREIENEVSYDILRNWTLLTNAGDLLLPKDDFNKLIDFHNINEKLAIEIKVSCKHNSSMNCTITRQDFIDILATNRTFNYLNETWFIWQQTFSTNKSEFMPTLQTLNEAYVPNEQHSIKSYWEMLSEYEEGYSKAQTLWKEVEPLYKKLHNFVKIRISNYYNISQDDPTIPVYLLGSNFGTDWSHVADIVLPHPYLYNEVQTELKYQTVKEIYKLAEGTTKKMRLGNDFGKKFWSNSIFNFSSCGPYVFSNCGNKYTEVITCSNLGWTEYLNIHETALTVALRNQDYSSIARRDMRFSAVDEAIQNLGSIIAIESLPVYDFIPKNAFSKDENDIYNRQNTALLLLALKVLPKLPFYLLADTWRLEELEFSYGNFTETWWQKRKEIQGVSGSTNLDVDFLGDSYITSNKPYLSKYFGLFIQFQLLDHFKRYFSIENGTVVDFIGRDDNFLELIQDRPNKKWPDLLSYYYALEEVSSDMLLKYFKPLENYLDTAPLEQITFSTTEKPRPTKPITKPTTKRLRTTKRRKNVTENTTSPLQNDETTKQPDKPDIRSEINEVNSSSSGQLGLIIGIIGVIIVGILLIAIVLTLRKKKKKRINNRRFET